MFLSIQEFIKRLGTLYNNDVHQTVQLNVALHNVIKANLSLQAGQAETTSEWTKC